MATTLHLAEGVQQLSAQLSDAVAEFREFYQTYYRSETAKVGALPEGSAGARERLTARFTAVKERVVRLEELAARCRTIAGDALARSEGARVASTSLARQGRFFPATTGREPLATRAPRDFFGAPHAPTDACGITQMAVYGGFNLAALHPSDPWAQQIKQAQESAAAESARRRRGRAARAEAEETGPAAHAEQSRVAEAAPPEASDTGVDAGDEEEYETEWEKMAQEADGDAPEAADELAGALGDVLDDLNLLGSDIEDL